MTRLQRLALAPIVAVIEIVLIAVFIAGCAVALCEWARGE